MSGIPARTLRKIRLCRPAMACIICNHVLRCSGVRKQRWISIGMIRNQRPDIAACNRSKTMKEGQLLRVYPVDYEPLALKLLARLLDRTGRVQIAGSTTRPEEALEYLEKNTADALFLDIQMPGMTGFELLSRLDSQPMVV